VDLFYSLQLAGGLASGEGLIWHVRDDPNIVDKRLLVVESEFARVLKVMSRPNNTLSMVLRDSWDNGTLRTVTKNDPSKATNAHISIIGHITEEELEKEMGEVDVFNGFANRFLWVAAKRSQCLPQGGKLDPVVLNDFITKLKSSLLTARKIETMTRSPEANEYWNSIYPTLTSANLGMLGATTNRAAPQVVRISMILALTDGSATITLPHLQAALALWNHCFQSACKLFGHRVANPYAQKILNKLKERPEDMTRTEISVEVFGRNLSAQLLGLALQELLDQQVASAV
jgi:uncharacterized protein DUF3987